jgi:hypothetical protein
LTYTLLMNDTTVDTSVFTVSEFTTKIMIETYTTNVTKAGSYYFKFYTDYESITYEVDFKI